jgi:hypothetical protein
MLVKNLTQNSKRFASRRLVLNVKNRTESSQRNLIVIRAKMEHIPLPHKKGLAY